MKAVVVDDERVARNRLKRMLGRLEDVQVIGEAGLSESLLREFESAISHHELIKVRVRAADRASRDSLIGQLCRQGSAQLVQRVGNVALVYRPNPDEPRISLP